jgi:hypothetical protein
MLRNDLYLKKGNIHVREKNHVAVLNELQFVRGGYLRLLLSNSYPPSSLSPLLLVAVKNLSVNTGIISTE